MLQLPQQITDAGCEMGPVGFSLRLSKGSFFVSEQDGWSKNKKKTFSVANTEFNIFSVVLLLHSPLTSSSCNCSTRYPMEEVMRERAKRASKFT